MARSYLAFFAMFPSSTVRPLPLLDIRVARSRHSLVPPFMPIFGTIPLYLGTIQAGWLAKQGEKFFLENRYEEAINAYDKALQLQPSLAEVWNNRGVVLTKLQRYHEAIASYEQAIQLRSDYSDAWNNRGVALGKLKYYDAAVLSYDRAIQLKENYLDAWNNRGFALTQLKQYEEAITSYQKAEEINPDFYLIWYNKSRCYAMQEKAKLALDSLEQAIKLKPGITRNLAKKETDFAAIQNEDKFQKLING